jgi:Tfp pilus tip-associated adhesin PilY1
MALQQCFRIHLNRDIDSSELSYRKSLDDISISSKKTSKSTKKSRKTSNIFASTSNDIEQQQQHTQSSWSIFTNKFKPQRTLSTQHESTSPSSSVPQSPTLNLEYHPMKSLALTILLSPRKLNDLLDFPSLNNNHLLDDDMKTIMNAYNLEEVDSSNQI